MYLPHHSERVGEGLIGKIATDISISCPPAVTPIVAGERIDRYAIEILKYYGIEEVEVLD